MIHENYAKVAEICHLMDRINVLSYTRRITFNKLSHCGKYTFQSYPSDEVTFSCAYLKFVPKNKEPDWNTIIQYVRSSTGRKYNNRGTISITGITGHSEQFLSKDNKNKIVSFYDSDDEVTHLEVPQEFYSKDGAEEFLFQQSTINLDDKMEKMYLVYCVSSALEAGECSTRECIMNFSTEEYDAILDFMRKIYENVFE